MRITEDHQTTEPPYVAPSESPRSALVWDAYATDRANLVDQLTRSGLQAHAVASEPEVLAAVVGPDAPDLLVAEPWSQGQLRLDIIDRIRCLRPDIRIVIVTGYASLSVACEAVRRGAHACLNKPASAVQILAAARPDATVALPPKLLSLARVEWEYLQWVLLACGGNKSQAARHLGLHRSTLQRKLAKYPPSDT